MGQAKLIIPVYICQDECMYRELLSQFNHFMSKPYFILPGGIKFFVCPGKSPNCTELIAVVAGTTAALFIYHKQ